MFHLYTVPPRVAALAKREMVAQKKRNGYCRISICYYSTVDNDKIVCEFIERILFLVFLLQFKSSMAKGTMASPPFFRTYASNPPNRPINLNVIYPKS